MDEKIDDLRGMLAEKQTPIQCVKIRSKIEIYGSVECENSYLIRVLQLWSVGCFR